MTRLLGIDPGLQRTGWGVIDHKGSQLTYVDAGVIATDADAPLPERLRALHEGLAAIIATHAPHSAAIEETFVNKNSGSSLKLAHARGAVMLSLSLAGLPVAEYAANLVKKSVVGTGHADKNQIAHMVRILLPGCKALKADAMDALAVAVTHAHMRKGSGFGDQGSRKNK